MLSNNALFLIKFVKPILKVLFSLTCFSSAEYLTFLQFQAYVANEDSSVVSYKTFNQDNADTYPTLTICLFGSNGEIFETLAGWSPADCGYRCMNATYKMQNPSKCNKNCNYYNSDTYFRTMRGKLYDNYNLSLLEFEDKVVELVPIITAFRTRQKEGKIVRKIDTLRGISSESIFSTTYHDAFYVCYTKERDAGEDVLLSYDDLEMNAEKMLGLNNYQMHFFIHQRGQLLRKLGTPDYVLKDKMMKDEKSFSYEITLRTSSVDVLEKRPDAFPSCNPNIRNEDNVWITNSVNVLGCVPPFLKRFLMNASLSVGNEVALQCSQEQYANFSKNLHPRIHYETLAKQYVAPCTQMTSIVTSKDTLIVEKDKGSGYGIDFGRNKDRKKVTVRIEYSAVGFREIRNYKAFGLLSLWSQIGGFIGIFLGYSLLQVPELITDIIKWAKHFISNN